MTRFLKRLSCKLTQHSWAWSEFTDDNGKVLGYFWQCSTCDESFLEPHQ